MRSAGSRLFGLPRMQQTGVGDGDRIFPSASAASLILAPFFPLGGLAFCTRGPGGVWSCSTVCQSSASVLGGVLFAIPLGLGLIMTLLAGALAAGWPLLQAAVAAGAEDALDALSRTFGYVNQRIGSLVALAGFAWLQGMIGIILMNILAGGVIRMTEWGLGLTGPAAQIATIFGGAGEASAGDLDGRAMRSGWAW